MELRLGYLEDLSKECFILVGAFVSTKDHMLPYLSAFHFLRHLLRASIYYLKHINLWYFIRVEATLRTLLIHGPLLYEPQSHWNQARMCDYTSTISNHKSYVFIERTHIPPFGEDLVHGT